MYAVKISNNGGSAFNITSDNYKFTIDNKGGGITPPSALLAALGSCVGVYIKKYSDGAGLAINSFEIDVHSDLSKKSPYRFETITINIGLKGAALDDRRKKALLEFVKNCPVHNTILGNPAINCVLT